MHSCLDDRETPKPVDWQDLHSLIDRHQLCALNCHQAWHATYTGPGIGNVATIITRVDYVFTWDKLADDDSKKCSYIELYVLTAHRHNAQHIPTACSVRHGLPKPEAKFSQLQTDAALRSFVRISLMHGSTGQLNWPSKCRVPLTSSKPCKASLPALVRSTPAYMIPVPTCHVLGCIGIPHERLA